MTHLVQEIVYSDYRDVCDEIFWNLDRFKMRVTVLSVSKQSDSGAKNENELRHLYCHLIFHIVPVNIPTN